MLYYKNCLGRAINCKAAAFQRSYGWPLREVFRNELSFFSNKQQKIKSLETFWFQVTSKGTLCLYVNDSCWKSIRILDQKLGVKLTTAPFVRLKMGHGVETFTYVSNKLINSRSWTLVLFFMFTYVMKISFSLVDMLWLHQTANFKGHRWCKFQFRTISGSWDLCRDVHLHPCKLLELCWKAELSHSLITARLNSNHSVCSQNISDDCFWNAWK